jgi:DNA helicase II / ATP-dependent DNA helicase PcrA
VAEAKGHDFDVVFLTGFEEGLLPGARAIRSGGEAIDAERRLAYVGLTRARNRLIVTRALTRTIFGQPRPGEPSRFLAEAGKRVRHFRLGTARPGHLAPSGAATEPEQVLRVVREGQRVVHPRYGPGLVVRVDLAGQTMVTVRLDSGDEKRLALAFARLQPA